MTTIVEGGSVVSGKRWFSEALGPSFEGGLSRELLEFICGDRLGAGMSREVFRMALNDTLVIKFEPMEHRFQNVEEMTVWQTVEHRLDGLAKWFAPCRAISGCGRILIQDYAEPIAASALPAKVPNWFTDMKPSNWGMLKGQPVCVDYGRTLMLQTGLTKRLKLANWT